MDNGSNYVKSLRARGKFTQAGGDWSSEQRFRELLRERITVMVFNGVVNLLAHLLVDLLRILPSLGGSTVVCSIVFLEVDQGVEMADA